MALKKPNTICKNRNCTKGKDGGRKVFYSCKYCVHTVNKRSVACCDECFEEYIRQVNEARAHKDPVDLLPERTDMSQDEVYDLVMKADHETVVRETKEELSEELAESPELGFGQIVDQINEEIDKNAEEGGA